MKISDEGGYWPRRSERTLRQKLDQMNGIVAGVAGALKDAWGDGTRPIQSAILAHPNFEQLEAEGVRQHAHDIAAAVRAIAKISRR